MKPREHHPGYARIYTEAQLLAEREGFDWLDLSDEEVAEYRKEAAKRLGYSLAGDGSIVDNAPEVMDNAPEDAHEDAHDDAHEKGDENMKKATVVKTMKKNVRAKGQVKGQVKKVSKASKPVVSKAAFIRALPQGTSAADAIAKGKAAGLVLTAGHYYAVRSTDKKKARKAKRAAAVAKPSVMGSALRREEDVLRAAAASIGLGRAIDLLEGERRRVRDLIASMGAGKS
jgi:hypothetical protein